jgi:hypothetical protein
MSCARSFEGCSRAEAEERLRSWLQATIDDHLRALESSLLARHALDDDIDAVDNALAASDDFMRASLDELVRDFRAALDRLPLVP